MVNCVLHEVKTLISRTGSMGNVYIIDGAVYRSIGDTSSWKASMVKPSLLVNQFFFFGNC